jgi:iron complex transport system substrate-binding protein
VRIASLLPSATEILFALELGDSVVGVTHECDFPPEAKSKPALLRPRVDPNAKPEELDRQVMEIVRRGESIYAVDAELLEKLQPDLIVTQDLCHVCAASPDDLAAALARFTKSPRVLSLTPHSLEDVWRDIRRVGEATGRASEGATLAANLAARIAAVAAATRNAKTRPRVVCIEWFGPFYVAGHWVPEMIRLAGGKDALGQEGMPSFRVSAEQLCAAAPEVIVIAPCGYSLERTVREFQEIRHMQEWKKVLHNTRARLFAVDANSYISRPGPRLADAVEILGQILHPEIPAGNLPRNAVAALD